MNIRYWNQGPDHRYEGPLSIVPKAVQTGLSYYSTTPPKTAAIPLKHGGHISVSWPPFFSVFVSKGNGRYRSFRLGWRFDPNVGDGKNPREPFHDPPGAYIADVIAKGSIDHVVQP